MMESPGVGQKTANVVASIIYNVPAIAVDTHVFRVSHRLGLAKGAGPFGNGKGAAKGYSYGKMERCPSLVHLAWTQNLQSA